MTSPGANPDTELVEALGAHPFTQGLSAGGLAKLAAIAEIVTYAENHVVIKARERATHFYLVLSGSMSVELADPVCTVRIEAIEAGGAFSWSALLAGGESLFRVRAREKSTVLRMDGQQLVELCRRDHELCFQLLGRRLPELMASRLRSAEAKLLKFWGTEP